MAAEGSNLIALYVIVPAVVFLLVIVVLYYCCSRKYRLNWFERTLLEASEEKTSEKEYINPPTASTSAGPALDHGSMHRTSIQSHKSDRSSSVTSTGIPFISHPLAASQPPALISAKYSPLFEPHFPPMANAYPTSPSSDKSSISEQQFWVPPAVLQKKRAQSLVPQLLQPQEPPEDSGTFHRFTPRTINYLCGVELSLSLCV